MLSASEILASVRSLYADELKPFGRVLLKRLRERAAARQARAQQLPEHSVDPDSMPRVNPRHLQKLCETCRQLQVAREDGREYSVTLVGQPCSFLDVCSPVDPYPHRFWETFATYLDSVSPDEGRLPGGRYACARLLRSRHLPFLQGYSLGRVCHVVQLAISARRLLGYREGCLVPYLHSEGWVKEQCAVAQAPMGLESFPVVSWDEARTLLRVLLSSHRQAEPGGIMISNLKRLFRLDFQRELSQTALGHVRLLDLLSDPGLSDICTLHAQHNGQVLVQGITTSTQWCSAVPAGVWVPLGSLPMMAVTTMPEHVGVPVLPEVPHECDEIRTLKSYCTESTAEEPLDSDLSSDNEGLGSSSSFQEDTDDGEDKDGRWAINVKNTFIDVLVKDPSFPLSCTKHRRRSVPAHMGARARH